MGPIKYKELRTDDRDSGYDGSLTKTYDQVNYDGRSSYKENENKNFKIQIWKNVLVESISFFLLFTAFNPVANLQSSINKKLGVVGLWVIYVFALLSCIFMPSYFIRHLGSKWTISISMLCYSAYIGAQFYPTYYTIIPSAALVGIGAGPLWASNSVYITQIGKLYNSNINPAKPDATLPLFFGVFFLFFQLAAVPGNFISSTVLSNGEKNVTGLRTANYDSCGAAYCPLDQPKEAEKPSINFSEDATQKFGTMFSIFLVFSLLAAVVNALFLDSIEKLSSRKVDSRSMPSSFKLIIATFRHLRTNKFQILLIPLTMSTGLRHAFFSSNFTVAYVTCEYGVHQIGYVMIWYGITNASFSLCTSVLSQKMGRVAIFSGGIFLDLLLLMILLLWKPDPHYTYGPVLFASVWGIADAVVQTQINALYGIIFSEDTEAAFSNLAMWQNLGFIVIYNLGDRCVGQIIVLNICVLAIGAIFYLGVESSHRKKVKSFSLY